MTCGWQDIRWMPRGERAFGGGCVLSVSHPTSMCVCVCACHALADQCVPNIYQPDDQWPPGSFNSFPGP